MSFSAEFRHPVEGIPFVRLVTDVALKIISFFFFFFCVCVFERLFISRYKSEFLNCGIFVFSISIHDN